jgi:hypothetical protein
MIFRLKVFFLLLLTWTLAGSHGVSASEKSELCHHGVCFERETELDHLKLILRGFGTKRFWGFTVYDAGLYLPEDLRDTEAILGPVAKKLVLRYHRSIAKEDILRASWHNLENNPGLALEALRARIEQLHSKFRSVKAHDQYALLFVPGKGTELLFNGKSEIFIPGDDFQRAYFGIWLSDHPISKKLKRDLLDLRGK